MVCFCGFILYTFSAIPELIIIHANQNNLWSTSQKEARHHLREYKIRYL